MIRSILMALSIVAGVCIVTPASHAQKTGWDRVRWLDAGTKIHIQMKEGHDTKCKMVSATQDSITCAVDGKSVTFSRDNIRTIKAHHGWRSAAAWGAVGAGTGALAGVYAAGTTWDTSPGRDILFTALGVMVFAIIRDILPDTLYRA